MLTGSPFGGGSLTRIQKEQLGLAFESGSVSDGEYSWVEDTSKNWTGDQWIGYPATLKTSHGEYHVTILGNDPDRFGFTPVVDTAIPAVLTMDDTVALGVLTVNCIGTISGAAGNGVEIILQHGDTDTGMDFVVWDGAARTLTITVDSDGLGDPRAMMTSGIETLINGDSIAATLFLAVYGEAGSLVPGTYTASGGVDGNMADGTYHIFKFAGPA